MKNTASIYDQLTIYFKLAKIPLQNVFLAGGCLVDTSTPKDIDVFCRDLITIQKLEEVMGIIGKTVAKTKNASTYKIKGIDPEIQIIKILTGNPKDVVKQFDFEQNASYVEFSSGFFIKRTNSSSLLKVCDSPKTPLTLLSRLCLMLRKGYKIESKELDVIMSKVKIAAMKHGPEKVFDKNDLGSFYEKKEV